jgi:hypothetical protein
LGRHPTAEPAASRNQCSERWKNRDDELIELVKKQGSIVGAKFAIGAHELIPAEYFPSPQELKDLELRAPLNLLNER